MKSLSYTPKDLSPGILLDRESGKFQIFGTSCPEDAVEFYDPIFEWFDEYSENPLKTTELEFKMNYFNSVSAKIILMIMIKMENLSDSGYDVKIKWFHNGDEDDLEEAGGEFEDIVDVKFEMISLKSKTNGSDDDEFFDSIIEDIF